jgi:rhodanese-related sulfurtransferase
MNINITPNELYKVLEAKKSDLILLDVREPEELEICQIQGNTHIRLSELPVRFNELPKDKQIVVYCKAGGRSMQAASFLLHNGFSNIKNLDGGILRWAKDLDPQMPTY